MYVCEYYIVKVVVNQVDHDNIKNDRMYVCGKTKNDRLNIDFIRRTVGVVFIEEKDNR